MVTIQCIGIWRALSTDIDILSSISCECDVLACECVRCGKIVTGLLSIERLSCNSIESDFRWTRSMSSGMMVLACWSIGTCTFWDHLQRQSIFLIILFIFWSDEKSKVRENCNKSNGVVQNDGVCVFRCGCDAAAFAHSALLECFLST